MKKANLTQYLANILLVGAADGRIAEPEGRAIEIILREIKADIKDLDNAAEYIGKGRRQITPTGRFSDRVKNLEDMIFVALADGELFPAEKEAVLKFAKQINLSQPQLDEILTETKSRLKPPSH